ncbi:MAG TPA: prephenate dehydrogenase/arogenate dehydrogenase family protein [Nitrososphaeraceae archaeon]|nr:prephenate dehydrogenase/arogenate dehydrogenase family protein [Nitrososphaeraceae archaeon]
MIKEIAIIGAAGNMGCWFSSYFNKKGIGLCVYDLDAASLKSYSNTIICKNISDCVHAADLVLICVPIKDTPSMIEQCASQMKPGAILAEISSVKNQTFTRLRKLSSTIKPLCIHPMFGPGRADSKQMKILLIPVKNKENEIKISNEIFEEAAITVIPNANIHDKLIAIVLGLTHYTNIVFASIISKENFSYLREVSGTTFEVQSLLAASMFTEEPDLVASLLLENNSVTKHIQRYLCEANKIAKLIYNGNSKDLRKKYVKTRAILQQQQDIELSYKVMYDIVEKLRSKIFRIIR